MFSYVIGILIAGLIVFGLHFGMQVGSPAYARQAIADKAAVKSLDELEAMLSSDLRSEKVAAITAIGQGDDQLDRRVALIALATADTDRSVGSICRLSIQRMGDRAKPGIRKLLASSSPEIIRSACGVIRPLGTNGDEFGDQLLKLFNEGDRLDRHAVLYGIQEMSPEILVKGIDGVIEELDDADFNTQCQACFVLQQMGRGAEPATQRLVQLLQEGNVSTRSRAVQALAAIGPVEGYDIPGLVVGRLKAAAFVEKARTLEAVAELGSAANTPEHRKAIKYLIDNPRHNCVSEASLAYYRVTGEKDEALRTLRDQLRKRNGRMAALECLGAMGDDATDAVPEILEFLKDEDLAICETAVLALKHIGPTAESALPRLRKMLKHDDFLITVAAQEAIDSISGKNAGN